MKLDKYPPILHSSLRFRSTAYDTYTVACEINEDTIVPRTLSETRYLCPYYTVVYDEIKNLYDSQTNHVWSVDLPTRLLYYTHVNTRIKYHV